MDSDTVNHVFGARAGEIMERTVAELTGGPGAANAQRTARGVARSRAHARSVRDGALHGRVRQERLHPPPADGPVDVPGQLRHAVEGAPGRCPVLGRMSARDRQCWVVVTGTLRHQAGHERRRHRTAAEHNGQFHIPRKRLQRVTVAVRRHSQVAVS